MSEKKDEELSFAEKIKTIQIGAGATPSRNISRRGRPKDKPLYNSWEAGIPTDKRAMPYLNENGAVVHQKEFSEKRRNWR